MAPAAWLVLFGALPLGAADPDVHGPGVALLGKWAGVVRLSKVEMSLTCEFRPDGEVDMTVAGSRLGGPYRVTYRVLPTRRVRFTVLTRDGPTGPWRPLGIQEMRYRIANDVLYMQLPATECFRRPREFRRVNARQGDRP